MGGTAAEGGLRRRMPLRRYRGGPPVGAGALSTRAMRYYRLWIYTCNTALLAGSIAFCGAAARTLIFDYRRFLIPSLTLYQPSFLYAYLALATQGGALQILGCVGAVRLSERMLNAYWLLLLVLLFGDVVLGAFWAFRFDRVCQELRPGLRIKLLQEYGAGGDLTILWDRLQRESECCGLTGPGDYNNRSGYQLEMPPSCCAEPSRNVNETRCVRPHASGCDERLLTYLRDTASLLAILGEPYLLAVGKREWSLLLLRHWSDKKYTNLNANVNPNVNAISNANVNANSNLMIQVQSSAFQGPASKIMVPPSSMVDPAYEMDAATKFAGTAS
ncbi:tetraspanin-9-like [Photinus pyralis]|uniref:tetraspanin-9-like n=1 Tax=Photinus pyralis TaxID=7054 RepID=UPI0012673A0F|nr:tetraspanin-9-like [Photinus pyralis]